MLLTAQPQSNTVLGISKSITGNVERGELCIIGDGAIGLAAGVILAGERQNLRVLIAGAQPSLEKRIPLEFEVCPRGSAVVSQRGKTDFAMISADPESALKGADGIVIAAGATEYSAIARRLLESFRNGQTVYLIDAPLAGGLQFASCIQSLDPDLQLNVLELGSLFDAASISKGSDGNVLRISGTREKVAACGNSRNETHRGLSVASNLARELVPTSNSLERGLADVEKVLRPTILLFAMLGAREKTLDCISNIINPNLTKMVTALEEEVQAIGKAFKCVTHTFLETLTDFSGVLWEEADCLDQALISVAPNLVGQSDVIPMAKAVELIKRDVGETLVLLTELARLARIPAPILNSIVDLSAVVTRTDIRKQGRGLHDLGLMGFDVTEIVELINA